MKKFICGTAVMTCEPTTIATIAAVAATVGAGVSAYSQYEAGQTQKKAGEYNAEIGRQKAQDTLQRGAIDAANKRTQARKVAAAQAEGAAMSGVALDSGTPLALLTETAGLGELDAMRIRNNAFREAYGYKAQSELDIYQGKAAGRAGTLNAGGTFLSGAASGASSYYGIINAKAA